MLILGIETTCLPSSFNKERGSMVGLALLCNYKIIAEVKISLTDPSIDFFPLLDSFLKENSVSPEQIDLLGVSVGPGSWTGIRLGLAFVKGFLSLFPKKEAIGISTSEILDHFPKVTLPSPALLGKLAYQKYREGKKGELRPLYGKATFKLYEKS